MNKKIIISMIVALVAIVGVVFLLLNKDSKKYNDYVNKETSVGGTINEYGEDKDIDRLLKQCLISIDELDTYGVDRDSISITSYSIINGNVYIVPIGDITVYLTIDNGSLSNYNIHTGAG